MMLYITIGVLVNILLDIINEEDDYWTYMDRFGLLILWPVVVIGTIIILIKNR